MFMPNQNQFRNPRPLRFGRGGSILRARPEQALELTEVQQHVPAVFAMAAHESRSEKFRPIPTSIVLENMLKEGFQIVGARQGGSRIEGKREFTKHRVTLRHVSQPTEIKLGGLVAEVNITNANDGTSAYWVECGMMRYVCLNGMMVAGPQFETIKVRHQGREDQIVQEVIEASYKVIETMPIAIEMSHQMEGIALTDRQRWAFADAARYLRWDGQDEHGTPETPPVTPAQVLHANRSEDATRTLWTTFNTVQENLMKGGRHMGYQTAPTEQNRRGQHREVAPIKGIDKDRGLNQALWILSQNLKDLIAA